MENINNQISEQIQSGENYYFDNYEQNVEDTLNEDNFYITLLGLMIYFQQYDIAPYSSGIPQFLIPYSNKIIIRPRCQS